MIRYHVDVPDGLRAQAVFALRLLLESEGIVAIKTDDREVADLIYSADQPPRGVEALWVSHRRADWDDPGLPVGWHEGVPFVGSRGRSGADPVLAAYWIATGAAEKGQDRNQVGVPVARGGRLWKAGFIQRPVVADLASSLRSRLETALLVRNQQLEVVPRWPSGKDYAVLLTHDVDRPLSRPPAAHYHARFRRNMHNREWGSLLRTTIGYVRNALIMGDAGKNPERDPQFGFSRWMKVADELATRTAFYVAVRGSADPIAHPRDVYYDASHPAITRALRDATGRGFEVGLHASIMCREQNGLFRDERERLVKILDGEQVRGLRHHYWALDADYPEVTLRAHEEAGFLYDSSLGMNDAPGFRRGVAHPFRPYDRIAGKTLQILQVPATAMDAGIFYHDKTGADPVAELEAHLDLIRDVRGCAVFNWHLAQVDGRRMSGAGPIFMRVLKRWFLHDGDRIYSTTPSELVKWWVARRRKVFPDEADR